MSSHEDSMNDISMTSTDYRVIDDARDHCVRALSAAAAAQPFDSSAMVVLDNVRTKLKRCLQQLEAIKRDARVTS